MTDIASIVAIDRTIEIIHPKTGEPLGIRVKVVSMDDDRLTKVKRQILDRRLYLEARGKTFKAEEIEENSVNILFAATLDWEWYKPDNGEQATFQGSVPDFIRRNFGDVVGKLPWFRDQLHEALGETKDFFG